MIRARVHHGLLEIQDPIPEEWEGHLVKLTPLTPDDAPPDLEEWLATLHNMGPMKFEEGERESAKQALAELDGISRAAMQAVEEPRP